MYHEPVSTASVRGLASGLVLSLLSLGCAEPAWVRLRWPSERANQLAQPQGHAASVRLDLRATTITWEPDAIAIELALVHAGACEQLVLAEASAMLEYDGLEYASVPPSAALVIEAGVETRLALRYELGRTLRGPGARVLLRGLACDDRHVDDPPAIAIPPMPLP